MWGRPLPGATSSSRMWWGWHRDSWGEGPMLLSPWHPSTQVPCPGQGVKR